MRRGGAEKFRAAHPSRSQAPNQRDASIRGIQRGGRRCCRHRGRSGPGRRVDPCDDARCAIWPSGRSRADAAKRRNARAGRPVVRAYRSSIDGSVQPYAVTFPPDYGRVPGKKWRLDVVLHGRDRSLNEVKFLHQYSGDKDAPRGQDFVQLNVYGRGNNAYRWAGEADVFEAIDAFLAVERLLGRMESELRYIDVQEIFDRGLLPFLDGVQANCRRVGQEIQRTFFLV